MKKIGIKRFWLGMIIMLTALLLFIMCSSPENGRGGGTYTKPGESDGEEENSTPNTSGERDGEGENNTSGTPDENGEGGSTGGGSSSGGNNGILQLNAYLSKDTNGTCFDLIITEYIDNSIKLNTARSIDSTFSSYKLVVTPKGNKPIVSKGTAQRKSNGIVLTPENQVSAIIDVTLNMDEISSIIIPPFDETLTQPIGQVTPYHIYIAGNTGYTGLWDGNNDTNGIKPCYWNGKKRIDLPVPYAPSGTLGTGGDASKIIMKKMIFMLLVLIIICQITVL